MMVLKRYLKIVTVTALMLIFTACGGSSSSSDKQDGPVEVTQEEFQTSTYISKGNFDEVASFAYKRVTDPAFTQYAMEVSLPGSDDSEIAKLSAYNIRAISTSEGLKKIIIQNHVNTLEVKIVDEERVNILLRANSFTVDRKMSLAELSTTWSEEQI